MAWTCAASLGAVAWADAPEIPPEPEAPQIAESPAAAPPQSPDAPDLPDPTPAAGPEPDDGSRPKTGYPPPEPGPLPDELAEGEVLPDAAEIDGPAFRVSSFRIMFAGRHPEHPDINELEQIAVPLALTTTGWAVPAEHRRPRMVRLADVPRLREQRFHQSAVENVLYALRDELNARGIIGVRVLPGVRPPDQDPPPVHQLAFVRDEANPDRILYQDQRPEGEGYLVLLVQTAVVSDVRTLAAGDRVPTEERLNNPAHARIRAESPLQPGWLLKRPVLDDYLSQLNRHPGRTVDAAVSAGLEPGQATLDYLVYESKPWLVYGQVSNTGTESTGETRYAAGAYFNQFTGRDDTFVVEYSTPDLEDTQALTTRYVLPLVPPKTLRVEIDGSWSKYTAEDVGLPGADFHGRSWTAGGLLGLNVYQSGDLFVDVLGGGRIERVHVDNELAGVEGEEDFVILSGGLGLERETEVSQTRVRAMIDWNFRDLAGTNPNEIDRLGRFDADADFTVLRWEASQSMYLEPIVAPRQFHDRSDAAWSSLAHEVRLGFRGQWAFMDDRLVPTQTAAAGGLYTVRGYHESEIAGDTVLIASAEYRFHIPRVFRPDPEPPEVFGSPFRFAPQQVYGQPDWDLVLVGFFDYAKVMFSDPLPFEDEAELMGTGVGVEFSFKRYLTARVDWGYALSDAGETDSGDSRVHFLIAVLY